MGTFVANPVRPTRWMLWPLWFVGALAPLAGCSEPPDLGPCSGSVELTATGGSSPTFNWTPCGVNLLTVYDAAGASMWTVHAPDTLNTLFPPVTYGRRPAGAMEDSAAIPLRSGFGYTVRVFRVAHDLHGLTSVQAGETNFRY